MNPNDSMFNPDLFLETQIQGQLDTERRRIPEGTYTAVVQAVEKPVVMQTQRGMQPRLQVRLEVDTSSVENEIGQSKAIRSYDCWLDLNASGGLDTGPGKNISLGRIRAACGQNDPNLKWAPSMLIGSVIQVYVKHQAIKSGEREGEIVDRIDKVAAV